MGFLIEQARNVCRRLYFLKVKKWMFPYVLYFYLGISKLTGIDVKFFLSLVTESYTRFPVSKI